MNEIICEIGEMSGSSERKWMLWMRI